MTQRPMTQGAEILLTEAIHPAAVALLEESGCRVSSCADALGEDDLPPLDGVRILGIRSKSRVTATLLERAPDLLAIGCFCIGTNQIDLDDACRSGVAVFNAPFSNTRSVAEMTIGEIIALNRRLFDRSMAMHAGRWDKTTAHAHEVRGRTLGIVGYGHIGSQVSILAEALGMHVVYHDTVQKLPLGNARPLGSLDAVLDVADVLTIHVPATRDTEGLIGPAAIARMRPGALLINNARGSVVDLAALADALRAEKLGGAALDVYPAEPSARRESFGCDLAGLPNVILTPHIGGSTEEAQESIARDVAAKLMRYLHNGTTTSAVNVPEVELPQLRPDQHRLLHIHRNVPGVLSKMHAILAEHDVNIYAEYLQSNSEVSYVILDVDPHDAEAVQRGLEAIPETIRLRALY